jgi:hypothetical protein
MITKGNSVLRRVEGVMDRKIPYNYIMRGQALITLLFFIVISVTITSAAIVMILTGSTAATDVQEGTRAYYVAESGIEEALLRLLRDPAFTNETVTITDGSVVITVSGSSPYTITAVGTVGNNQRTIQATAEYSSGALAVSEWKEI